MSVSRERVMDILYNCYDPEIPVNIVDLGLVYDVQVNDDVVSVKMTLTSQGCPAHGQITQSVKEKLESLEGVREANIEIVWDPPWDPSRMSDAARQQLGIDV
jgi:metal-sulfur cluster biosynthetic enzyme